jgi:hypothetical protein
MPRQVQQVNVYDEPSSSLQAKTGLKAQLVYGLGVREALVIFSTRFALHRAEYVNDIAASLASLAL